MTITRVRFAVWIACVPLAFALGACSTSNGARSAAGTGGTAAGGSYYLDDGPGQLSPADVAAIPDAVPRAEPLLVRTSRPYTVFGRTYAPMSTLAPYRERGIASWYGRRYHGKPTSSGEPYDMYAMTAAHPTLPIPSYVRVTRTGTSRSVVVRVNDRGPFLQNRLIDLSYTAAAKLGFVEMGSAEVEVESITQFDEPGGPMLVAAPDGAVAAVGAGAVRSGGAAAPVGAAPSGAEDRPVALTVASSRVDVPTDSSKREEVPGRLVVETRFSDESRDLDQTPPPASQAGAPGFWLQLGAFASADGARTALERLRRELAWLGTRFDLHHEGGLYKVQAGPWPQREHALDAAARVRGATGLQSFPIFR